jgi:hypothetical protein
MSTDNAQFNTDPFHIVNHAVAGVADTPKPSDGSFGSAVAHLVKVFVGIRPMLTLIAETKLFPPNWRSAAETLILALDAVAAGAGGVDANFKAGKDL